MFVCCFQNHQNFSHSRLPNLLPVLLDIGNSHERNTLTESMTATSEDPRQIIDGTITETGHESRNIQVQLSLDKIELIDEGGTFCTTIIIANPELDLLTGEEGKSYDSDPESEVTESTVMAELQLQIESLTAEKQAMAETLTNLEQERARAVWKTSCTQLEGYDRIIADRDATIATLTEKVRQLEGAPIVDTPPTMTATRTTPIVTTTTRTTPGPIVTTPAGQLQPSQLCWEH